MYDVEGYNYYRLLPDGSTEPVGDDPMAATRDIGERRVDLTEVGEYEVSTVFLWIDHRFGDGPPLLFETMVFRRDGDHMDLLCERYTTKAAAQAGHDQIVAALRDGVDPAEIELPS